MALNSYYCDIDIDPDVVDWLAASIDVTPDAVVMYVHNIHYFDSPYLDMANDLLNNLFDCSSSCNCIRSNQLNLLAPKYTGVAFHQHLHFD